jgi:uncharacterized protein YkwD
MKRRYGSWVVRVFAIAVVATTSAARGGTAPADYSDLERQVARQVNDYRVGKKLGKLAYDDRVAAIARAHSVDMASGREHLGHAGFKDRAAAVDRITPYNAIAENVALNDYSPTRTVVVAVQGWLHSPHHLENIAGEYDHTGVGVARAADGTFYYTQLFVSRRR